MKRPMRLMTSQVGHWARVRVARGMVEAKVNMGEDDLRALILGKNFARPGHGRVNAEYR